MRINESESHPTGVVARRIRWLAIATGCVTAVAGSLSFGWLFPIVSSFLILGAIAQPRSPRPGRWLMWVGAFSLSLAVLPIGVSVLFDAVKTLRSYHDYDVLGVISLWVVSFLLVTWCDAALVIEAVGMGRERRAVAQPHSPPAGRWLMWVAALGLSLWLLPGSVLGVLSYRRHGRLDILLFSVVSGFVVTLFDVALLIDAFKMWRAQRTGKTKAVPSCSSGDSPTESE